MEKKDYFSRQSKAYAAFRPVYPDELYRFIFGHLGECRCAWDCATGSGQVARELANHFDEVYATDISSAQLANAYRSENIFYSVSPAEHTTFSDHQFDLITVAQAIHWFDLDLFYQEVRRTARPNGLIAVWGYGLISTGQVTDALLLDFYHNSVGPYWDPARKMIEDHYQGTPFPFEEITCPSFEITASWGIDRLAGYLNSWSAVQKHIEAHGSNPVDAFIDKLKTHWKGEVPVKFPVFMKLGKVS